MIKYTFKLKLELYILKIVLPYNLAGCRQLSEMLKTAQDAK